MVIRLFKIFNLNQLEKEYYQHFLKEWGTQFIIAATIVLVSVLLLSINDFVIVKNIEERSLMLIFRLITIGLSFFSIVIIRNNKSINIFNTISFLWLLTCSILSFCVAISRPEEYTFGFIWDILFIIVVFLVVPATISIQTFVALVYSVAIFGLWFFTKIPVIGTAATYSFLLALIIANILGFVFSWQLKKSACKQFLLYKQDQEIKEKLNQQNESKNKFFSMISHDLRSPVGNIISICNMAQDNSNIPHNELITLIRDSSKMTYSLLENLLAWAKSESGQLVPVPIEFNVREFIGDKILFFEHNAKAKHIVLQSNVDRDITVCADYNMIDTVLRNLLSNAIKFTPENGTVSVSAEEKGNNVEILVKDNGIGIEEHVLPKLFDIDYHHTGLGTHHEPGTGLGLKLCKEFITKNGGELGIESTKTVGTTLTFSLPRADS